MNQVNCKRCEEYTILYGVDLGCPAHRLPDEDGYYMIGCRKCDNIIKNVNPEDSLCSRCAN